MTTATRALIAADLKANFQATGVKAFIKALILSPGFSTALTYRLAAALRARRWRLLAELVWRRNVARSGCFLHIDSRIGPGLCLPHATAVVVGEGVVIGPDATLYQGVTLGQGRNGAYPTLGRGVTVFPNAVVVGPVRIGDGAVIGASSFVACDVPAHTVFAGNPARLIRQLQPAEDAAAQP